MPDYISKLLKDNEATNEVIKAVADAIKGFDLQVVVDALGQIQNAAYAEGYRLETAKYSARSEADRVFGNDGNAGVPN